jgi:hypothetical protein
VSGRVLNQSVWNPVVGNPSWIFWNKHLLGLSASRFFFLCRKYCVWIWRVISIDDGATSNNVFPTKVQFLMFRTGLNWSSYERWWAPGDTLLSTIFSLCCLCNSLVCRFPLTVIKIFFSVATSSGRAFWSDTVAKNKSACLQLCWLCKHLASFYCSRTFEALHVSTFILTPHNFVRNTLL